MAGALPALQQCILRRWVWSALCLKPFPYVGCWWSLTVKAGGEQDGCCDLRLEAGGAAPSMRSHHGCLVWKLFLTLGTGGWLDPGVAKGLALPGEPAHLPLPWGIVLSALGALLPPLVSSGSVVLGLGRAFVRRPRLGRSLLRGSVFRPFSWSVLRVTLTAESCGEKRRTWAVFVLLIPPQDEGLRSPPWGDVEERFGKRQSCVSDAGRGWGWPWGSLVSES